MLCINLLGILFAGHFISYLSHYLLTQLPSGFSFTSLFALLISVYHCLVNLPCSASLHRYLARLFHLWHGYFTLHLYLVVQYFLASLLVASYFELTSLHGTIIFTFASILAVHFIFITQLLIFAWVPLSFALDHTICLWHRYFLGILFAVLFYFTHSIHLCLSYSSLLGYLYLSWSYFLASYLWHASIVI